MTAGYHLWAPLLQGNIFVTLEIIDAVEPWSTEGTILPSEPPAPQPLGEKPQRKDGEEGLSALPTAVLQISLDYRSRESSEG